MAPWIPTVIASGTLTILVMAERFYTRFYPDVETQKKHLRRLGSMVLLAITFGVSLFGIVVVMRRSGPPTQLDILVIAIDVSVITGTALLWGLGSLMRI